MSVISLSSIQCPQSNLYTDRYNLLLKIRPGPSGCPWTWVHVLYMSVSMYMYTARGGPWTGSTEVVHGPGPWGGPWTGSTGVVHGPGSMFCIRPLFPYKLSVCMEIAYFILVI